MAGGEFVKTTFVYGDDLHRLTSRSYNDGTPTVTYSYDTATKGVGRLASVVTNNVSTTSYTAYDPLGRLLDYNQQTASQTYTMSRAYNRASLVISDTYPSQKVIQTEYDTAGRIAGVSRGVNYYAGALASDATNRIHYSPAGAVDRMKLGNGLWEHADFNSRLQPGLIGLGSSATTSGTLKLEYDYGSTGNNGNVLSQKITAPTASGTLLLTENYTYDKLNRLLTANEKVNQESSARWTQTFTFDRWGNRTGLTNTGELPAANQLAVNPATNRFSSVLYDEAGNQLRDEANHPLTYDAENHQKSFTAGGITYNYSYDGDGRRVKRDYNDGTAHTTIFVYNASGQLIAEYTSDPVPPPQGSGGVSYLTTDHLGSPRVMTNSTGGVKSRHDYLPFGEDIGSTVSSRSTVVGYNLQDGLRQKFTQKERDGESALDYFGERYYSSSQGRFTSTDNYDPVLSRQVAANRNEAEEEFRKYLRQPQHWNRYPYVINNPLRYLDPTGEQELEAITRAVVKLAKNLAKYRGVLSRGLAQGAVQPALTLAFGPALDFKGGNLQDHEKTFAKEVMYMEGRSFMAVGAANEPGIDGLLYDPGFSIALNLHPQAISLTETGGGVGSILNAAAGHEESASNAGYSNVDLYIKATNKDVDVAKMVDFVKGGKQNLLEITKRGVIKSITIVLKDGVVRIQDGKVYAGITQ